jgi:hypothetical protein
VVGESRAQRRRRLAGSGSARSDSGHAPSGRSGGLGRRIGDYRVNALNYLRSEGVTATARKAVMVTARVSRAQAAQLAGRFR